MILRKIWERYLFYETLKVIFFFAFTFYFLYALIDYSIHAKQFAKIAHLNLLNIATYYFYIFIKRLDLILSLAFLIALNKILLDLSERRELVALLAGGLKKTLLLRPFFLMGFLISLILLANFEYLIPHAFCYLENFENQNLRKNKKIGYTKTSTYTLAVKGGGKLIFSSYDPTTHRFDDVYYIISPDELWKIKTILLHPSHIEALFAQHLTRDENNQLILNAYYENKIFPNLEIDFLMRKKGQINFEQESLSSLYLMLTKNKAFHQKDLIKIQTQLFFKLGVSFLSFLAIIACTPFCIIFARKLPIFMIYAMSIFGMITFFTMMDSAVILVESHTLPSAIAILSPLLIALILFGPKFIKSCKN